MNKYIIKNCSCYNKDYSCQSKDNITGKYCKDITDCVLKRIVELCNRNIDRVYYLDGNLKVMQGNKLAVDILELLEIEEVDER